MGIAFLGASLIAGSSNAPHMSLEPSALATCVSGFDDWCSATLDSKGEATGCWVCTYSSYKDCKEKIVNTTYNTCRAKSDL
jgi:hypothetical protein